MNSQPFLWQQELAEAFSNVEALCRHLDLNPESLPLLPSFKTFPLRVPRGFVDLMQSGNPDDPLLRQILPLKNELQDYPGYSLDPVGDLTAVVSPGILHKYHGRVLLIATGACAVHCRYCFRRNFPYGELQLSSRKIEQAMTYIAEHPEISEVILSGGDPLLLNDDKLEQLLQTISVIPQIKRIRIHSRIPVVLPSRITPQLIDLFNASDKPIVLVLHTNHANELGPKQETACCRLRQQHITLLNQSVLLKGINDDADTLCQLSDKLFSCGILPYYLHLLDQAVGTGHFAVDENQAGQLMRQLRQQLPGYLVPRLVKEQAGADFKLPVCESLPN